jgi:hypothetical protein
MIVLAKELLVKQMEIDLGDYIGYSNLRIRFNFIGKRDGDIWT